MAQPRPSPEPADITGGENLYNSLMPVRRITQATTALLEAPAPEAPAPTDLSQTTAPEGEPGEAEAPRADASQAAAEAPPSVKAPLANWQTLHVLARMAFDQRDFETAAGWWRLMRLGFPDVFHGHADGALAMMEMGRFDEGRQLLSDAEPDFPDEPGFPATRAQLEARAGDWPAAVTAWRAAMDFPASPWWACTNLVDALERAGGSSEEIDAILGQGCRDPRFRTPMVCAKAVSVALRREDWMELAERLTILGEICSDDELLGMELGAVLVPMRDASPAALDAAIQAPWLDRVIASPQSEPRRLILQARLAQLSGRVADVMAKLAALRPVMPLTVDGYLRLESILRDAGLPDATDAMRAAATDRLPPDPAI